jgi:hypothetical protein
MEEETSRRDREMKYVRGIEVQVKSNGRRKLQGA